MRITKGFKDDVCDCDQAVRDAGYAFSTARTHVRSNAFSRLLYAYFAQETLIS